MAVLLDMVTALALLTLGTRRATVMRFDDAQESLLAPRSGPTALG
ncbi:hypothetical protein ACFUJR_39090 [Streptomyces sp. NPDC057271]